VTVRPLESLTLGPVGLNHRKSVQYSTVQYNQKIGGAAMDGIPHDNRPLLIIKFLMGGRRRNKRFGRPVVDQFINLLFRHPSAHCLPLTKQAHKHTASVSCTFFCVLYLGASK
jgi:hypothetical protein